MNQLNMERAEALNIQDFQELMDTGEITSVDLVHFYLERICSIDQAGINLNSVVQINPDALHIAEYLDLERKRGSTRGPLHGIVVLLKDNLDTGDKMHTSAGTLALAASRAREDSFVAHRLREAGVVILGKANLTEMANFMTRGMPNGYSSRGGQVLNPYGPGDFDVGGSSSGSAAGVSAHMATAAIGTETSGSILSPASSNSVVGIKPTVGLVSRSGIIPISTSQDTAGPIARTVTDAAIMLGALTGVDDGDPVTRTSIGRACNDYTPFLRRDGLRRMRIGVMRDYLDKLDDDQLALLGEAITALEEGGASVIDPVSLGTGGERWVSKVLVYEFKPAINAYLDRLDPHVPVHSLRELVAFNYEHVPATMKYGQTTLLESEATSGTLTEPEYLRARQRDLRLSRDEGIDQVIREHALDALLFVNNVGAAIAARAGYPSITVPAGYREDGEPFGITLTGRAYAERELIAMAYAFEQICSRRVPPPLLQPERDCSNRETQ